VNASDPNARQPLVPFGAGLPREQKDIYLFTALNALNFQPILGGPMLLYAKSLGAGATVLGLLAGLMPLLVVAQLPAARYVNRLGYRRFILSGWTSRLTMVFAAAVLPWLGFLDAATRLVLLAACLFVFNILRGFFSSAWLPWTMELIPAPIRGRHFARDQFSMNAASIVALGFCGWLLGLGQGVWRFSAVFLFAALSGFASLFVLRRIPDPPPPPDTEPGKGPVPWLALAAHPPFRRLLVANVAWSVAYGGLTTFVVKFLRDAGWPEDKVMYALSFSFLGGLLAPWLAGPRLDRLGSKPVLAFTMVLGALIGIGWWWPAAGFSEVGWRFAAPLTALMGLIASLFSAANNRFALQLAPRMGRNHFFAIFMVVWQITLGTSPVLWGLLIDGIGTRSVHLAGCDWNRYSVYFALVTAAFAGAFICCERLAEDQAADTQVLVRELVLHEPRRWWSQLTGR
jgi:MFS family permease